MRNTGIGVLRVVVGLVFLIHGWGKMMTGFEVVSGGFEEAGVPMPIVSAVVTSLAEMVFGLAVAIGLYTRFTVIPLIVIMLVAMFVVHLPNGFFIRNNGFEYTLVLLTCLVTLAIAGPGWPAVDQLLKRRKKND